MTKTKKTGYMVVRPKAGYWLTNGESFSEEMFVPTDYDCTQLREVTTEEKERLEAELEAKIKAEMEAEMQAHNVTEEGYESAQG